MSANPYNFKLESFANNAGVLAVIVVSLVLIFIIMGHKKLINKNNVIFILVSLVGLSFFIASKDGIKNTPLDNKENVSPPSRPPSEPLPGGVKCSAVFSGSQGNSVNINCNK